MRLYLLYFLCRQLIERRLFLLLVAEPLGKVLQLGRSGLSPPLLLSIMLSSPYSQFACELMHPVISVLGALAVLLGNELLDLGFEVPHLALREKHNLALSLLHFYY